MKKLLFLSVLLITGHLSLITADDKSSVIRDKDGKIIGHVEDTANGKRIRDANGKIIGTIGKDKEKQEPKK